MDGIFFELIRVSIGTQDGLSQIPSTDDWDKLYDMAEKQTLVGVCFAGLSKLGADSVSGFASIGMSEEQFYKWMGRAVQIQEWNEIANLRCVELQKILLSAGFQSCILKGQGNALLYEKELWGLRQSGDIDVWLWCNGSLKERRRKIIEYARSLTPNAKAVIHHIDGKVFNDIETEFHYLPSWFYSPISHHSFLRWCESQAEMQMTHKVGEIIVPTVYFNSIYLLTHIKHHLFQEGIGLRQLMDYFGVLKAPESKKIDRAEWMETVNSFGLRKFAGAIMWIMQEQFGLKQEYLLCEPIAKEGTMLLNEILEGGNFGRYRGGVGVRRRNVVVRGLNSIRRINGFLLHYPSEVLWAPFWKLWHWFARKRF